MPLSTYFRSCFFCGVNWGKIEFACNPCLQKILSKQILKSYYLKEESSYFKVYYLFDWIKKDSWVGKMVHCLKGQNGQKTISKISKEIILKRLKSKTPIKLKSTVYFLPGPIGIRGPLDHSYIFAKSYGTILNKPVLKGALRKSDFSAQKELNRQSRANIKLILDPYVENYLDFSTKSTVIFVDDLVTTGNTAIRSYQTLLEKGWDGKFEVWAMACRHKETLI